MSVRPGAAVPEGWKLRVRRRKMDKCTYCAGGGRRQNLQLRLSTRAKYYGPPPPVSPEGRTSCRCAPRLCFDKSAARVRMARSIAEIYPMKLGGRTPDYGFGDVGLENGSNYSRIVRPTGLNAIVRRPLVRRRSPYLETPRAFVPDVKITFVRPRKGLLFAKAAGIRPSSPSMPPVVAFRFLFSSFCAHFIPRPLPHPFVSSHGRSPCRRQAS